jgi:hypothetical protein
MVEESLFAQLVPGNRRALRQRFAPMTYRCCKRKGVAAARAEAQLTVPFSCGRDTARRHAGVEHAKMAGDQ